MFSVAPLVSSRHADSAASEAVASGSVASDATVFDAADEAPLAVRVDEVIVRHPDWPTPGVVFADLAGLYARPVLLGEVVDSIARKVAGLGVTHIAALDARGFVLGTGLSLALQIPLVLIRKKGKLPGVCLEADYSLEYGIASVQMQVGAVGEGDRVLIADDILATGGTARGTASLIRAAGAQVAGVAVIGVVAGLNGEKGLDAPLLSVLGL